MADVEKPKKIRAAYKGHVTRVEKEIQTALDSKDLDVIKLQGLKNSYLEKIEKIKDLDGKIVDLVPDDEFDRELNEQLTYHEGSYQLLAVIDSKLATPAPSVPPTPTPVTSPTPPPTLVENRTKLPRLVVKPFDGRILYWQSFWDQFSSAVHERNDISEIDKFNYLKSLLTDKAEEVISGLSLSAGNYNSAIVLLKERYGNKQAQINAHMENLLKLCPVKTMNNVGGLRKLYDCIESSIRNLNTLDVKADAYGSLLIPLINEKLPTELRLEIGRKFNGALWKIVDVMTYFKEELLVREACLLDASKPTKDERYLPSTYSLYNTPGQRQDNNCLFCKLPHPTYKCRKVTDVNARKNILKKKGRCFRCLDSGHIIRACTSDYLCKACNGKHNITLCTSREKRSPETEWRPKVPNEDGKEKGATSKEWLTAVSTKNKCNILMMTARCDVKNPETMGKCSARILFDTGSQRTYITRDLRDKLKLKTHRKERIILNTFGNEASKATEVEIVDLKLLTKYIKKEITIEAICVPLICPNLENQRTIEIARNYRNFDELYFADFCNEDENGSKKVDVLVGLDYYSLFMTGKSKIGEEDEPFATETICGWVISGAHQSNFTSDIHTYVLRANVEEIIPKSMIYDENEDLKRSLEKFWAVESIPTIHPPPPTATPTILTSTDENEKAEFVSKFEKDIIFDGDRYSVKLPFKPYVKELPDNYTLAQRRMECLRRKLNKDDKLKNEYHNIIADYKEKGIIELVEDDFLGPPPVGMVHYMSHHAVCKENRETTKVRIVFDASAQISRNEPSLNDNLYTGPCLLPYIFDILLRFRIGKHALIADIKQAFLQIEVAEEHRNFLRFLWLCDPSDPSSNLEILRFCRVVFGLNCSPFLLAGTIQHHIKQFEIKHEGTDLAAKFLKDLYVDDTSNSFHDISTAKVFYEKLKEVMLKGGFHLCKWDSNCEELRNMWKIPNNYSEDKICQRKVLGVNWDVTEDRFVYEFEEILSHARNLKETKRNVLKVAAMFYDPLGLICPVVLQPKLIFKQLCLDKLEWDVAPGEEISHKWKNFVENMNNVKFEINRHIHIENNHGDVIEIHGFADASIQAYAAAVYIRVIHQQSVKMALLSAKSKVAPMKKLTVPRLELLSCLLLSKLVKSVIAAFTDELPMHDVILWTDSEISYYRITQVQKEWNTWVENRVNQIRDIAPPHSWRHIPGTNNPADVATRDMNPRKLMGNNLWWHGPNFLQTVDAKWPDIPSIPPTSANIEEKISKSEAKGPTLVLVNFNDELSADISKVIDIERYSSLEKLLRVTSYVLRFVRKLKRSVHPEYGDEINPENEVTTEEMNFSEEMWILSEQFLFKDEKTFERKEISLRLYHDERGIIRSRTRISEEYNLKFNPRHPILLRSGSQFTKLIVWRAHKTVKHQKVDATLNDVRIKYWITRGRQVVKNVLRQCVICNKFNSRTLLPPPTPDLPKYRVSYDVPFEVSGIDYAGPVFVKNIRERTTNKSYILLITCAASRCVHLELTSDLSSAPLILALRRFTARRGLSKIFISDNFTTFKSSDVKAYLRSNGIRWQFILDKAPNWGGFYERLIGLIKACLKKSLGKACLTYEELNTVLIEIENVINSRPLTYLSNDNFQCSLTPHHLIYGRNINEKYESTSVEPLQTASNLRGRVNYLRVVLHHFHNRFYHEYVTSLREKHQYVKNKTSNTCPATVGEIVLIKQDVIPRIRWKKGRIEQLIDGTDGFIRGAVLRVYQEKSGKTVLIKRPLQHLIPLEIRDVDAKVTENIEADLNDKISRESHTNVIKERDTSSEINFPNIDGDGSNDEQPERRNSLLKKPTCEESTLPI